MQQIIGMIVGAIAMQYCISTWGFTTIGIVLGITSPIVIVSVFIFIYNRYLK